MVALIFPVSLLLNGVLFSIVRHYWSRQPTELPSQLSLTHLSPAVGHPASSLGHGPYHLSTTWSPCGSGAHQPPLTLGVLPLPHLLYDP